MLDLLKEKQLKSLYMCVNGQKDTERQTHRQRDKQKQRQRDRNREAESMCMCVCARVSI